MTTGNRARRDPAEGRGASRVENRWPDTWEGALDPTNLSTNRQRIANLARLRRGEALYSLNHVIDLDWMKEAYRLTRKDGAPGIDGVTAATYEVNLEANLRDLLDRIKSGRYQAPPVRRAYIPKSDGTQRPLGIPTFEDKVARRIRRCTHCAAPSGASGSTGCWTSIYESTLTQSRTLTCAHSSTDESR